MLGNQQYISFDRNIIGSDSLIWSLGMGTEDRGVPINDTDSPVYTYTSVET